MADNHRWFKLWCTAPSDDGLLQLPPEQRWAWAALGCYTKAHGTDGVVHISDRNPVLAAAMGIKPEALRTCIEAFPHVRVSDRDSDRIPTAFSDRNEEMVGRHGEFTVTWKHWRKYQEDPTSGERARRYRAREASRSKRRREENKKLGTSTRSTSTKNPTDSFPELDTRGSHTANGPTSSDPAKDLLGFLNRKAGRRYRPTHTTLALIRARLASGATPDQIRSVIAVKVREWGNHPEMAQYLRPETLFRASKFESYLGQLPGEESV